MPNALISEAERANFLRQCWRTRRWKDGMGTLLLPLRMSIYQLRKEMRRTKNGHANGLAQADAFVRMPDFSSAVAPLFCDAQRLDAAELNTAGLFAAVAAQLQGTYRLAGGRTRAVDASSIDASDDAEDAHAYHRLYWLLRYAQAAALGHQGAREALPRELPAWLQSAKESRMACWPYTVAERIGSLTGALFWIAIGGAADLLALVPVIKQQIWRDARHLCLNVELGLGVHNHLLNDARGLFLAAAALDADYEYAAEWRDQAFRIWDEYFPKLTLEDGTFAEQSSHYHLLLCRTALEYFLASRRWGHALPEGFEERIRKMFELANELVREDGSVARFGHSSPDRTIEDLWGLLAAGFRYGLLREAPARQAITPLTIFYCGAVPEMPCARPMKNVRVFPEGGFAFVRSANLKASLVAHGDGRDGVGTHGDTGRGSYELWFDGDVLVREPGSFFSGDASRAIFFQGPAAQNVTTLDGLAPVITRNDERFLATWYRPEGGSWREIESGAEFRCDAFQRLHPDIVLVRTWKFERSDLLTFEERIEGSTRVRFESRVCLGDADWHFSPNSRASEQPSLRWYGADGRAAEMSLRAPNGIAATIEPCTFIPEYGIEKPGRVLLLQGTLPLPFSWKIQWKLRKAS